MSAPCPILGIVVTIDLRASATDAERDAIVYSLIEAIEAEGLSAGGGGDRSLEYVIHRDGAQATEQDRLVLETWAERWTGSGTVVVGPLTDLNDDAA